jgi:hypothetical protein
MTPWYTYAAAGVYFKNSFYVFGGGGAGVDGSIKVSRSIDRFFKMTITSLPCSKGTYYIEDI